MVRRIAIDCASYATEKVSNNIPDDASAEHPSISADGRFVAFSSYVGEGINEYASISVHDCNTNTTEKISAVGRSSPLFILSPFPQDLSLTQLKDKRYQISFA